MNAEQRGWSKVGPQTFIHQCGARVSTRGKREWTARTVDGSEQPSFANPELAFDWIEQNDRLFWSVGEWSFGGGLVEGMSAHGFHLDGQGDCHAMMYSLDSGSEIPAHLNSPLRRHLLSKATCIKCSAQNSDIYLRQIKAHHGAMGCKPRYFLVCQCGHPLWHMATDDEFAMERALRDTLYRAAATRLRKDKLKSAGGAHTPSELRQILFLQGNRCIYCNLLFSDSVCSTKDHLVPVSHGGAVWALNIVMACRRCNARRGEMPFRTYCKLLSPTQNRRIIRHLARRIEAINSDELPKEAFASLLMGLQPHEPRHLHFRSIVRNSPIHRYYAKVNRVIPSLPHLIVKKSTPR